MLLHFLWLSPVLMTASVSEMKFPDGVIVGGSNALITKYPYHVSIEYLGYHYCSGSIIHSFYIITAAHCAIHEPADLTVRAGSSMKNQGGTIHRVEKVVAHERYVINEHGIPVNDIAIITIIEGFDYDDVHKKIKLFDLNEKTESGMKAVITGWGNPFKGLPSQMQTVTVPIVNRTSCSKVYKNFGKLPPGQICAVYYGEGEVSCQGDSGAPLVIDDRQAGIVSWGNGCAKEDSPGVYTEIAYFRSWINEHAIINL